MDKASVALSATEDNAAAIRELNKKLSAAADNAAAIREINTKLPAIDDNAAAINALSAKLTERTDHRFVSGKASGSNTLFGSVTSDGNTAVIIVYSGSNIAAISFNKEKLHSSPSPILAVLPEGTGELSISGARSAHALILG